MKEDNNIEDLFRSSFDHFEVAPPSAVKEAIDSRIGGASNKRIWWILGTVLFLGVSSLLFFFARSSEKQGATAPVNQLASTETPANTSASTTTHSNNHSSTHHTATSSSGQSDDKNSTSSETTSGTKQQDHSARNQASSKGKNDGQGNRSLTSNTGNQKNRSAKTNLPKRKNTIGKNPSGKKSSGKKSNSGTLSFDALSTLNLTNLALKNSGIAIKEGNSSENGTGKSDPTKGNEGAGDGSNSPEKTDPISGKPNGSPTPQTPDSTNIEDVKPGNKNGKNDKPKSDTNWTASVYAGPSFGINSKSNDQLRSVSEKPSFQFSAEVNRNLIAGYGLTTGFGFNQRQETFKLTNLQILDSAIVIFDSIPLYENPNMPDSITGYQDTIYYFDDTLSTNFTQLNRIQTMSIPLYFTKHFSFSDKWGLLVNAGAVFQFYKVSQGELNGMPAPTVNNFSMNLTGRFHATYTWNQWMFSAGVSTGWEMKQALIYEGLDRKRYFITPQFGVHFRF
ncbi:MAG: hypothetical protein QE487_10505 [Fluviicola sp.]|nr:hypothetical protein [Fluviicola sp.]